MKQNGYTTERFVTTIPLAEYVPQCVDVPKFLGFCRDCPSYGTRWSCPPHNYDPMDLWARYETLTLVALVLTLDGSLSRTQGVPCWQPQRMRPSIEALGGDVSLTLERYLGKTLRWTREGERPETLTLVGGLLLPDARKGGAYG